MWHLTEREWPPTLKHESVNLPHHVFVRRRREYSNNRRRGISARGNGNLQLKHESVVILHYCFFCSWIFRTFEQQKVWYLTEREWPPSLDNESFLLLHHRGSHRLYEHWNNRRCGISPKGNGHPLYKMTAVFYSNIWLFIDFKNIQTTEGVVSHRKGMAPTLNK